MAEKKQPSFEDALNRLEAIVEELEDESISLERSIELYKEGIELSKVCTDTLENAQLQIEAVNKQHTDNQDS